ncbi:VOC family protein [Robertkochia flava]|uniref:VOC family protein n=1 Tax=Robertkochia flava TaxID=3447986 RepID=UPI001CCC7BB9|nr:VOC family protein [Robertkochia marina]
MKISELTLFTKNLEQQKQFYGGVMGLPFLEGSATHVRYKAGWSDLIFSQSEICNPVHFAFLIPGNSFKQAHAFLSERVDHLPYEGHDIIDFPNWNAKSQYFYDPDRNIVEFIARRDVKGTLHGDFSPEKITGIGEVGLPASDMEGLYEKLNTLGPIAKYSGDFMRFGSAGDPEGLFILANPDQKTWFPTGDKVLPAHLRVRGDLNFEYHDQEITEIK